MTKMDPSRSSPLLQVDLQPLFARLRSERLLQPERVQPERRNLIARRALLVRVRGEFHEMPGLSLTLAQATRLLGLSPEACTRVLNVLVSEGLLYQRRDGRYVSAMAGTSAARSA
jgi:hypothetical protein